MKWFILLGALLVVTGCQSAPEPVVSAEVAARADQLSEILTTSRSSLNSQVATLDAITVQSSVLESIAARLDVLIDIQQPLGVEVETKEVPASTEAVVVEASEPVSGREVIQQSTSTSSSDTVADDGVHFEMWTATWCGPCRVTKPRVRAIAKEFGIREPRMLEWDEYKADPVAVQIHDLPTINVLRRGKSRVTLVGEQTAEAIRAAVQQVQSMQINDSVTSSSDDLTIRNKLPAVNTRWGLVDLEEVNADGTCQCERCVELRALRSAYLEKPEYQNIGRKVEPETF